MRYRFLLGAGGVYKHDEERLGCEGLAQVLTVHLEVALFALAEPEPSSRRIQIAL